MKGLKIYFSNKNNDGLYPYNEDTSEPVDMDTLKNTRSCIQYDSDALSIYNIGGEGSTYNNFNGNLIPIFTKDAGFVEDGALGRPVSMTVLIPLESFKIGTAYIETGDWLIGGDSIYRVKRRSESGNSVIIDGLSLNRPILRDFEVPLSMFDMSGIFSPKYEAPKDPGTYVDRNGFEWVCTGNDFHLKDMSNELSVGWGGSKFPEFFGPFTKKDA